MLSTLPPLRDAGGTIVLEEADDDTRTVTFRVAVNEFSGTFQAVSLLLTSSSSPKFPYCAICSAAIAVTGLLIEAA